MANVIADSGQLFLECDVELILNMANDRFINEHNSLEYRYTDQEVCDHWDITPAELERMKNTLKMF